MFDSRRDIAELLEGIDERGVNVDAAAARGDAENFCSMPPFDAICASGATTCGRVSTAVTPK